MPLTEDTRQRIRQMVESNRVMLFMKGTRQAPECGFSANVVGILDALVSDYETFDVLSDLEIREGIKEYSSWPTIPQLYLEGELVGGSDIVSELVASGELHHRLGVPVPEVRVPSFRITNAAVNEVHVAAARMNVPDGYQLRIMIDARGENRLGFTPPGPQDVQVESNGVRVLMDPATAARADGLVLDAVETETGREFRLGRAVEGGGVRQVSPAELRELLTEGVALFDVRTTDERVIARIEGSRLLDEEAVAHIESLDRETPIAFHCHHGVRSQSAAEHFVKLGFQHVFNLAGGIDAWSREVDPSVARY